MSNREAHFESMLFNYETTGRTDFRDGEIVPDIKTVYKSKPGCLRPRPPPLKDLHAMTEWKVPNVTFSLMHKPKAIVRTNPRHIQEPYAKPIDDLREEVQKSRPRLVMTPAVSLDDADDSSRARLVKETYTTSAMKMVQDSRIAIGDSLRAPLSPVYAPADPISLKKRVQAPYVSPEWRMDSAAWDLRQLRVYSDPTRDFWLRRTPKCQVCEETAEREAIQKIKRMQQH